MKKGRILKRILCVLLTVAMLAGYIPQTKAAAAQETDAIGQSTLPVESGALSVEATNDFGELAADAIDDKLQETEANEGYNIFSVEVSGTTATVTLETLSDATVIVGIYDEAGEAMKAVGTAEVTAEDEKINVEIDSTALPQYFYVRAFLVDTINGRALCTAYESPNYTQEMQEFFQKSQEDFDEDRVLSLDDENTDNFAVFSDDTFIINQTEGTNVVEKADSDNGEYVFSNANDDITSLREGEVFAYKCTDGTTIIAKVGSITVDGTTATITEEDSDIDDVFDYVRYEESVDIDDSMIDTSVADEHITYFDSAEEGEQAQLSGDGESEIGFQKKLEVEFARSEDEKISGKITATAGFKAEAKLYKSVSYQYVELKITTSMKMEIGVEGQLAKKEFTFFAVDVPFEPFGIKFTPKFVFEASGKITASASYEDVTGVAASSSDGIRDISEKPKFESDIDFSATIFIGLKLDPRLYFIQDKILNVGITATTGVEVEAAFAKIETDGSMQHDCGSCLEGTASLKFEISAGVKLFDRLSYDFASAGVKVKLFDFYSSKKYEEFGLGKCPHIQYLVTVKVVDRNGNPVEKAVVNNVESTNINGIAKLLLPSGEQSVTAKKNGSSGSATFLVGDTSRSVTINIGGTDGVSGSEDEEVTYGPVVSAGVSSTAIVTGDGDLYTWGYNSYGQLGDGTRNTRTTPTNITDDNAVSGLPSGQVAYVSMGYNHGAAVLKNGDLYTWGDNSYGQLGDGTTVTSYVPKLVMRNVKSVACGNCVTAAVTQSGELYTWGQARYGALGNGVASNTKYCTPQRIMDNVESVDVSNYNDYDCMAAVDKAGNLYTWGSNNGYGLGTGSSADVSTPKQILKNVASASVGYNHGMAVTESGRLYVWGSNSHGQLGVSGTTSESVPRYVADNISKVSCGSYVSAVLSRDGNLYTCGAGQGTVLTKVLSGVRDMAVGGSSWYSNNTYTSYPRFHAIAVTGSGRVYTWGYKSSGQLGNGETSTSVSSTPQMITLKSNAQYLASAATASTAAVSAVAALADTTSSGDTNTSTFSGLTAGGVYNFYSVRYRGMDKPFVSGNILYVKQAVADENGELTISFTPTATSITSTEFVVAMNQVSFDDADVYIEDVVYNGGVQTVIPTVSCGETELTYGVDYEISGDMAGDVGAHTVTLYGKGLYCGNCEVTYNVVAGDCSKLTIQHIQDVTYTGEAICPEVTVTDGAYKLVSGQDYKISYQNNTNAGYGIAVVEGMNSYSGKGTALFEITGKSIDGAAVEIGRQDYTGSAVVPETVVTVDGVELVNGRDYDAVFYDNTEIGTARAVITAKGNYTGTVEATFDIGEAIPELSKPVITAKRSAADSTVIAWKKVPDATGYFVYRATNGGKYKLIKTISNAGVCRLADKKAVTNGSKYIYCVKAYVKVAGVVYTSDRSEGVTTYFINQGRTTSITSGVRSACTVRWKTNSAATGYQVQYSTSSTFAKNARLVTVAGRSTGYRTLKGLKSGTKYYVRVRTYKKVGKNTYYSAWSSACSKVVK